MIHRIPTSLVARTLRPPRRQSGVPLGQRNTGDLQGRPPGLDTVQEFRIETAVSSAKLDRPANAIFSTRSGTNTLHGALFETGRNSGFGVARQRQDTFTKPPHLVRDEFGASGGAPIFLPKIYNGKNRTFFFFAWEEARTRSASTVSANVWPAADRIGDFSALTAGRSRSTIRTRLGPARPIRRLRSWGTRSRSG
jgi:hypothetical protein